MWHSGIVVILVLATLISNILLGTARHVISIWSDLKIVGDKDLNVIQQKVYSFVTPDDVGCIPSKISSSFSGFTAEQWRNWTLIFSLYSLKEILPHSHYNCWHLFVKACYALCGRSISLEELKLGDTLIMEFYCKFQELYGEKYCNINLDLHVHLASCILDFVPVYSFWLFSFERMNGSLGTFHTNCRDVTLQLMCKFMQINQSGLNYWPDEYKSAFSPLIAEFRYSKGALIPKSLESTLSCGKCTPLPPLHEHALSCSIKSSILSSLSVLNYFTSNCTIEILSLYQKCKSVKLERFILGSKCSRHTASSIVLIKTLRVRSKSS